MAPSTTTEKGGYKTTASKIDWTIFRNLINGKLFDSKTHSHGINPATRERLQDVPVATKDDLDEAVKAARAAFNKWRKVPREVRNACVLKYADAIEANTSELAKLLTTEQGKPLFLANFEIGGCVAWLRGLSTLQIKDEILEETEERKVVVRYTPLGVVGAIVPWNFPCMLSIGKIGPAVLTGNTIIVKPSPFTPYTALKLAELAMFCFPPGVIQTLAGNDDLGPWMTSHPDIDKISFTGSSTTGKKVAAVAAATMKRVTLELGGNDPAIVCSKVDIPRVAAAVCTYALINSGQLCVGIKRVYIHSSIYSEFRQAMVDYIKTLKVGDGFAAGTFLGPVQNEMQYDKVKSLFKDIEKEKWTVAIGGTIDENATGYYINPTIIDNPSDTSRIVVEEPFGPILPILSWESEEEVLERVNNSKMGLGASVWSNDLAEAERMARQIESGTVWINTHFDTSPAIPAGGHKQSGVGVEWGVIGMKGMCNQQTLNIHNTHLRDSQQVLGYKASRL